jgi:hypothetical protein
MRSAIALFGVKGFLQTPGALGFDAPGGDSGDFALD